MDYLPGYWFDPRTHNYMTRLTNGQVRFVARAEVMRLLESNVQEKERLMARLTEAVIEGRLAPAVWQAQMATELKRLYLQNRALGAGGWDRLTARDFGHVGGRLASEYRYLARFGQQIADGQVTQGQALVRLRMYLGHARREFWLAERDHRRASRPDRMIIERRTLGIAEHCADCVRYAALGWQPAGVLPPPSTDSECDGNCRCDMDAIEISMTDLDQWLGTKRRPEAAVKLLRSPARAETGGEWKWTKI